MNREEAFATKIYKRNRNTVLASNMELAGCLFLALVTSVTLEYDRLLGRDRFLVILDLCALLFLGSLYVVTFISSYIQMESKDGKTVQTIWGILRYMPISSEQYFSVVKRKFRNRQYKITAAAFGIFFLGMWFGFDSHDNLKIYYLNMNPAAGYLPRAAAVCVLGALCVYIALELFSRIYIWAIKNGLDMEDESGKEKKYTEGSGNKGKAISPVKRKRRTVLLFAFMVIVGIALLGFDRLLLLLLHPMPKDTVVYYSNHSTATLVPFAGGVYLACMGDYLGQSLRGGEVLPKKKMVGATLVILVIIFFNQMMYTGYYEDKIEVKRIWGSKEYTWEDVSGYEISTAELDTCIQMRLTMKDGKKLYVTATYTEASELYFDTYGDEWKYVAAIVERLDGLGVNGTIKDSKKLKKCAEDYGDSAVKVYQELEETIMGGVS